MGESFGRLLRGYRTALGLTQEALAERALLSHQAVGALERGDRRFPRADTVTRLADALGLSEPEQAELAAAATRRGRGRPRVAVRPSVVDEDRGQACRPGLPGDIADFTGRADELETCARWAAKPGGRAPVIVAVTGMAGSGKSTLAVHVAHQFAERFAGGQLFIDLHGHTPGREPVPAQIALGELLRWMGVPGAQLPDGLAARAALWRSELAGRRTLIVLDNARDAGQVRPLLPGSPGHLVLVTSRDRLADLDGAVDLPVEPMPGPDAAELLARVARHPIGDGAAVADVVELCGRLPLGIRLAGTRLRHRRSWTAAGLAGRLREQQRRLAELPAGTRGVAGAFELSYHHLPAVGQRVFRLLGLHPGPDIDACAAAALCDLPVDEARRQLEQLAEAQLLREPAPDRYTPHDLLRAYAMSTAHQAESEPDRRAALTGLLDYYGRAAAEANRVIDPLQWQYPGHTGIPIRDAPAFDGPGQALEWWETERANLLAAIPAAARSGLDVQAWQLAQALVPLFSQMGYAQDRHDTHRIALRSARRLGNRAAEANILVDLASACHRLGRPDEARTHYENATALARTIGNCHTEGRALARLGVLHQAEGDLRQAGAMMHKALALFRSLGDSRHEAVTLVGLAVLAGHADRPTEALQHFAAALSIMERVGPSIHRARAYHGLGLLYARLGRFAEAHDELHRALRHARAMRDREGEAQALFGLGLVQLSQGSPRDARESLHRVLEVGRAGLRLGSLEAKALSALGVVHARLGNRTDAVALHEKALSIADTYGDRDVRAAILNDLAGTYAGADRHTEAAKAYREALALAGEIGLRHEEARARAGLAHLLTDLLT